MKRWIIVVFMLILSLVVAACGGSTQEGAPAEPAVEEPAVGEPAVGEPAVGEPAEEAAEVETTTEEEAAPETEAEAPAEEAAETEAPAEDDGPILIGGTLGLTGAFAGPSADYKLAYDLWLERVNAEGGLLGRPVEMIVYDDESTPATAQALYQRLINEDGVDLILAPYHHVYRGRYHPNR